MSYEGGEKEIIRHMEQSLAFIVTLVKLQPIKKNYPHHKF